MKFHSSCFIFNKIVSQSLQYLILSSNLKRSKAMNFYIIIAFFNLKNSKKIKNYFLKKHFKQDSHRQN